MLLYVLNWNITAVAVCPHWNIPVDIVCSPLEHSSCYCTYGTGTFVLLLCALHWNISAVTVCPIVIFVLPWNIPAVTVFPALEHLCC